MNTVDMYIKDMKKFKETLLQNIDMSNLQYMSSADFDMCKQALKLFDSSIEIMQYQMTMLELMDKRTELIAKQNELILNKLK